MCSVDVFASRLVEESNDWENICQKATRLTRRILLTRATRLAVPWFIVPPIRGKLRSSKSLQRKLFQIGGSVTRMSCHLMTTLKRLRMSRMRDSPRKTWEMLAWKHWSSNPLNCKGLQHPPCCRHCSHAWIFVAFWTASKNEEERTPSFVSLRRWPSSRSRLPRQWKLCAEQRRHRRGRLRWL